MAIHELDKLSNLKNLKFRGNPILENRTVETARQLIIARIAKLKVLNGKEILHDERRDVLFGIRSEKFNVCNKNSQSPALISKKEG
ncbi:tubulin-specific chaperone E-like isoform X2 [Mycetomoellerius zeteki]|uniref:tubulin-specific chaperone E-like isoform X2 n=1 Tax=Mycetomoellerius zeteki TaxID=64791 RepID=UPI00084E866F|nr:PREDICTED: tubulin-specific chaperone E-like isoform X2 [Trachymyrmex zeteki]